MITRRDIKRAIQQRDVNELKQIVKDVKNIKKFLEEDPDNFPMQLAILTRYYYGEANKFKKQVFVDQSTCDVTDGYESTVPYQVGLIKAYCQMIQKILINLPK